MRRKKLYLSIFRKSLMVAVPALMATAAALAAPEKPWFNHVRGELYALSFGYIRSANVLENYVRRSQAFPMVSQQGSLNGAQVLFSLFLFDSMTEKRQGLELLLESKGDPKELVEEFFLQETHRPFTFDAIFGDFIGYIFSHEGKTLPMNSAGIRGSFTLPSITNYATLKSFPVELRGTLQPYSFLSILLPDSLPRSAIIQVENTKDGSTPGSCAQNATVLWKPIHRKRIAVYAVGCDYWSPKDRIQFRLRVLDKPFLPSAL